MAQDVLSEKKETTMDFAYATKVLDLQAKLRDFMEARVLPNNERWHCEVEQGAYPLELIDDLKARAKAAGPVESVPARAARRRARHPA